MRTCWVPDDRCEWHREWRNIECQRNRFRNRKGYGGQGKVGGQSGAREAGH